MKNNKADNYQAYIVFYVSREMYSHINLNFNIHWTDRNGKMLIIIDVLNYL